MRETASALPLHGSCGEGPPRGAVANRRAGFPTGSLAWFAGRLRRVTVGESACRHACGRICSPTCSRARGRSAARAAGRSGGRPAAAAGGGSGCGARGWSDDAAWTRTWGREPRARDRWRSAAASRQEQGRRPGVGAAATAEAGHAQPAQAPRRDPRSEAACKAVRHPHRDCPLRPAQRRGRGSRRRARRRCAGRVRPPEAHKQDGSVRGTRAQTLDPAACP